MRSRDGNNDFSLRLCSIIVFNSLTLLHASEYLISYKYIIEDIMLYNETLLISEAMTKCHGKPYDELVFSKSDGKDLKKIISENSEEFIGFIHKLGLNIEHKETTANLQNSSRTTLVLKTTCFKVDFNDNFVKIAPLK
ncbi:MAG: hypothetical protein PHO62_09345 [Sulfurimonas sp.]|uniref:hypothetical protein n=1 Tax=Sulfurimonas sp. TaxID=2022749 RepID=UPI0026307EB1|nr:hypothetical protein [Sulfurimonas sp.]MDD5373613.1 hypothetical protein [Sulfurimonas sp.]